MAFRPLFDKLEGCLELVFDSIEKSSVKESVLLKQVQDLLSEQQQETSNTPIVSGTISPPVVPENLWMEERIKLEARYDEAAQQLRACQLAAKDFSTQRLTPQANVARMQVEKLSKELEQKVQIQEAFTDSEQDRCISSLRQELSANKLLRDSAKEEVSQIFQQFEKLQTQMRNNQNILSELSKLHARLTTENKELVSKVKSQEENEGSLKERLREMRSLVESLQQDLYSKQDELKELSNSNIAYKEHYSKAVEEYNKECEEKLRLFQELSDATRLMKEYKEMQIRSCSLVSGETNESKAEEIVRMPEAQDERIKELERSISESRANEKLAKMQYEELDSRHSKLVTEVHDMKEISQSKDFEIQELKEKLRLKQIELDEVIQIRDGQRKDMAKMNERISFLERQPPARLPPSKSNSLSTLSPPMKVATPPNSKKRPLPHAVPSLPVVSQKLLKSASHQTPNTSKPGYALINLVGKEMACCSIPPQGLMVACKKCSSKFHLSCLPDSNVNRNNFICCYCGEE